MTLGVAMVAEARTGDELLSAIASLARALLAPGKSDSRTNTGLVLHMDGNRVNQELAG